MLDHIQVESGARMTDLASNVEADGSGEPEV